MGTRRAQEPQGLSQAEAAALIALYVSAGSEEEDSGLIAEILLRTMDAAALAATGAAVAAELALELASWAFRGSTTRGADPDGTGAPEGFDLRLLDPVERPREATMRGLYLQAALGRMAADIAKRKSPENAQLKESRYFELHLQAARRRNAAANVVRNMSQMFGPVLGWYDMKDNRVRPLHARLGRENFQVGQPHPTEHYPGSKPNCRCVAGPPHPGAPLMNGTEVDSDSTRG